MAGSPVIQSKYDATSIKQTFDDLAVEILSETYKEDSTQLVVTSVLGIVSIAIACYGQFMVPFPQSWLVLVVLVVLNLLITASIQVYMYFTGSENLFQSKPTKFRPHPIIVTSYMERFSIDYSLTITSKTNPNVTEKLEKGANEWIRTDGTVDKETFSTQLRKTLQSVEASLNPKKQ
jgi:hypothetical protein